MIRKLFRYFDELTEKNKSRAKNRNTVELTHRNRKEKKKKIKSERINSKNFSRFALFYQIVSFFQFNFTFLNKGLNRFTFLQRVQKLCLIVVLNQNN